MLRSRRRAQKYSSLNVARTKWCGRMVPTTCCLLAFSIPVSILFLFLSISAFNSSSLSRHFVRNILSNDILSSQHFSRYICPRHFELNILFGNILSAIFCSATFCPLYFVRQQFVRYILSGNILSAIFCPATFCSATICSDMKMDLYHYIRSVSL
jgi:hypothetical protein